MESSLNCFMQIKNAQKIAIITHKNADTDALASSISMKRIIKDNFEKQDKKFVIDIFTETNEFNKKDEYLYQNEEFNNKTCEKYDLAIALDCTNRDRMGVYDYIFKDASDTLNIDHHLTNDRFAKNNIIASNCSSTCEIIFILFIQINKLKCSAGTLSVIYSGIITDTNNLSQNMGPKTFDAINILNKLTAKEGIELEQIRNHYFKSNTKEQNALLAHALNSLEYSEDGKIAIMKIEKDDFEKTNTDINDTLGIVDYAINTQGVEIGIIFINQNDNTYHVSLRSKNNINVGMIAQKMGGGGHTKIAAFQTNQNDNFENIKLKLIDLCEAEINKTKFLDDDDLSNLFADLFVEDQKNNDNK